MAVYQTPWGYFDSNDLCQECFIHFKIRGPDFHPCPTCLFKMRRFYDQDRKDREEVQKARERAEDAVDGAYERNRGGL